MLSFLVLYQSSISNIGVANIADYYLLHRLFATLQETILSYQEVDI